MKKILIIEDNQNDFQQFESWLNSQYKTFPEDLKAFRTMRSKFSVTYGKGNSKDHVNKAIAHLKAEVSRVDPDLVIVDYELKTDDESCHGIRFADDFLKGRKILLVTGSSVPQTVNKLIAYVEKNQNANWIFKEKSFNQNNLKGDMGEDFRVKFIEKVQKILPPENILDLNNII